MLETTNFKKEINYNGKVTGSSMQVRDQNIESPVCDCGIPKMMPSFLDAEVEHAPQILACAFILNINVYFHPIL